MKQSSLDEQEQMNMEMDAQNAENEEDINEYYRQFEDPTLNNGTADPTKNGMEQEMNKQNSIGPTSQIPDPLNCRLSNCLPWAPKVRQKDIYQFLDVSRNKFIGYSLPDDINTTAGLPQPICEGINILKDVSIYLENQGFLN